MGVDSSAEVVIFALNWAARPTILVRYRWLPRSHTDQKARRSSSVLVTSEGTKFARDAGIRVIAWPRSLIARGA